jgi:coproporphyrinogen III oxidase
MTLPTDIVLNQKGTSSFRENWITFICDLQDKICKELEDADEKSVFGEDVWERAGGGGGKTKVLINGKLIEKGGVNTSVVYGHVNDTMREQLKIDGSKWFACGISIVIHPINPYVPTVHANWRYFELYDETETVIDRWFGGGSDLTPYYIFEEDARHFHQTFKDAMDRSGREWYPKFKKQCDEYFANKHRNNETRGIGGVFYDFLRPADDPDAERLFQFQRANGNAFLKAYLPIVHRRKNQAYGEREIEWQEVRRGRYVEFNLLYDRGTLFGLRTNGRTESILMSLPPRARWNYNYEPVKGSEEDKLWQVCLHPKEWIPD